MINQADKVRENRLRRWAARLGYRLEKSRAKQLHLNNRGLYMLIDMSFHPNTVVEGDRYDASLDRIEMALSRIESRMHPRAAP